MKEETTTQWPQLQLLHYKFCLREPPGFMLSRFFSISRLPEEKQSNRFEALAKSGMSLSCL